ncbi:helix-turn-helix transcriptional regulator [Wenyingzhuangia sp. IMCC45574]
MTRQEEIEKLYIGLGNIIATARKKNNLTQQELAEKLEIGRTSIVNIEKGRQHTTLHILLDICIILNIDIVDIVSKSSYSIINSKKKLKSEIKNQIKNFNKTSEEDIDPSKIIKFIQNQT